MNSDDTSDRRKYPRIPMDAVMSVEHPSPSRGVDLSIGGIRFYCTGLGAEVGDTLHVEFMVRGQSFRVVGTVVRVTDLADPGQDVALAFGGLAPETLRLLEELLPHGER